MLASLARLIIKKVTCTLSWGKLGRLFGWGWREYQPKKAPVPHPHGVRHPRHQPAQKCQKKVWQFFFAFSQVRIPIKFAKLAKQQKGKVTPKYNMSIAMTANIYQVYLY